ncbi:hypothetical protein D3C72_1493290 [compost metagenome]
MQLAQDVVGQVAAGLGLAIDVDRYIGVLAANFGDEVAHIAHDQILVAALRKLLVIHRQDERTGAALLLGELREIAIAGHAQYLEALFLDRMGEVADAQTGGVLRAEILVDDDDGKAKFHGQCLTMNRANNRQEKKQARSVRNLELRFM